MSQPPIQEMVSFLRNSRTQLSFVDQQLTQLKQQELVLKNTIEEVNSLPLSDASDDSGSTKGKVWRSCGRGFVLQDKKVYLKDLKQNNDTLNEHMRALSIKKEYLTTTIEKTVENMKKHMK